MNEPFGAAYLLRRYRSEYGMPGIAGFVRNFILPITYFFGKLTGRYRKFKMAPKPLR